ncbi:MAG: hypothetical protein MHM6MM_005963 [Cercozoa sp. M6MM]
MDSWRPEWVQAFLEAGGNARVNARYEATMPASRKPRGFKDEASMRLFLRDKYERKLWLPADDDDAAAPEPRKRSEPKRSEPSQALKIACEPAARVATPVASSSSSKSSTPTHKVDLDAFFGTPSSTPGPSVSSARTDKNNSTDTGTKNNKKSLTAQQLANLFHS